MACCVSYGTFLSDPLPPRIRQMLLERKNRLAASRIWRRDLHNRLAARIVVALRLQRRENGGELPVVIMGGSPPDTLKAIGTINLYIDLLRNRR